MESKTDSDTLPRLLFVSPTHPDTQGNGLAMRAGLFIEALASIYRVTVLVVPIFGGHTLTSEALVQRYCERLIVVPPQAKTGLLARKMHILDASPPLVRMYSEQVGECLRALRGERFDVVHAFRLYTAPLAYSLAAVIGKSGRPLLHMDLDDVESSTHRSLAELYRSNGREDDYQKEATEARRYDAVEKRWLSKFQRVYVCSNHDAEEIRSVVRGDLRVAPNAIRSPEREILPLTTHPYTFLFVGTLSYYPNQDAVHFFCRRVLPKLQAAAGRQVLVRIVGSRPPGGLPFLPRLKDVRLVSDAPDIIREYADADAVIVPVRAGGGTRIKVLEAFACRRPVVSTTLGAAGIAVTPGVHCLLADTPETFAVQCLRLMKEPELGPRLAENAYELVTARYSPEVLRRAITDEVP